MAGWYIKVMGVESGPFISSALKAQALDGTITPDTLVRRGTDGEWVLAHRIQGLFEAVPAIARSASSPLEKEKVVASEPNATAAAVETLPDYPPVELPPVSAPSPLNLMPCGDCGKSISRRARTCPHCGCPWMENERPSEPPSKPITEKRYTIMQVFASLCRIFAILIFCIGVFIGVVSMASANDGTVGFAIIVATTTWSTLLFFQAELLSAIVDLEQNTRRTGDLTSTLIDTVWNR